MILYETSNSQKYTKDEFAFFQFLFSFAFISIVKSLHPLGLLGLHTQVTIQIIEEKKLRALVTVHAELEQTINC
jgi:hypothetical protein